MMDYCCDSWKEPVVRHGINSEDRLWQRHLRKCSPPGQQDSTLPAALEGVDHLFGKALFVSSHHAAKANVDRWWPSLEKVFEIGRWRPGSFGIKEPIPGDMAKGRLVCWPRHHLYAKPVEVRRVLPPHLRQGRVQGCAQDRMDRFAHRSSIQGPAHPFDNLC